MSAVIKNISTAAVLVVLPCWITAQIIPLYVPALGLALGLGILAWVPGHWLRRDGWWPRADGAILGVGALSNATALLVHKGSMPVTGMEDSARGIWRPYVDGDLLLIVDRFGGFSIGDILIGTSAILALAVWATTSIMRELRQPTKVSVVSTREGW